METKKTIVKNMTASYMAELVSDILSLVIVLSIARVFGDEGFGLYSFAFAFATIFTVISSFGLGTLLTREIAYDKKKSELYFSNILSMRIFIGVFSIIVPLAVLFVIKKPYNELIIILFALISVFFDKVTTIFSSGFYGYEKFEYPAFIQIVERLAASILVIFVVFAGYGLIWVVFVFVLSNFLKLLISYRKFNKECIKVKLAFDYGLWWKILKESIHFAGTTIFMNIYFKIDTIMLSFISGYKSTGLYNAAYKIIDVLTKIPFIFINTIFPTMSKLYKSDHNMLKAVYSKSVYYLSMLSFPIFTGLFLYSKEIILLLFGNQYIESYLALQILGAALVLVFVNYHMGFLLSSIRKEKIFTYTIGVCTAINITLNFIFIPKYGFIGAAYATLITEIINFVVLLYYTIKNGFYFGFMKLWKPILSSVIMYGILRYLNFNIFIDIFVGVISYFSILLILRGIDKEDIEFLKKAGSLRIEKLLKKS